MARGRQKTAEKSPTDGSSANLVFEAKLWAASDAPRNNMDAAGYKSVVLGFGMTLIPCLAFVPGVGRRITSCP